MILGSTDNVAYLMRDTDPNVAYTEVNDIAIPVYLVTDSIITDFGFDGDANKADLHDRRRFTACSSASRTPARTTPAATTSGRV